MTLATLNSDGRSTKSRHGRLTYLIIQKDTEIPMFTLLNVNICLKFIQEIRLVHQVCSQLSEALF